MDKKFWYGTCVVCLVLAVFDDVEVDSGLYYLVFGEALLNDGITYVMFEGFKSLGNLFF